MPPAKKTARQATKKTSKKTAKKATRKAVKRKPTRQLSAAHLKALSEGRTMSAVVDRYLAVLNTPKRRGRKVTKTSLEQRLVEARSRAKSATGIAKVLAAQQVRDVQAKLARANATGGADLKTLEADFIKVAKRFGDKRNIGYDAWRDAGVPADVLKSAGVARTRGR